MFSLCWTSREIQARVSVFPCLSMCCVFVLMALGACRRVQMISGRLRVLEEQCHAWRQKEALVYSVMISACLINTWLWLRR
uniref:Mff-like domain-containing protein n=1 Tax=Malurus cyaneus samueli TaxID=2593467 RepID=A0A8C5TQK2_9PASS